MDRETFEVADEHVERVAEHIAELLEGESFSAVRKQLAELSKVLRDEYSISLSVGIEVFDSEREQSLPLLRTGLATTSGSQPYLAWGDSSPQKYIVDGSMMIVPHDHCPSCWGEWDFKFRHTTCGDCGARLGEEVKVLLDADQCPSCQKETVSPTQMTCSECNFELDPSWVVWG